MVTQIIIPKFYFQIDLRLKEISKSFTFFDISDISYSKEILNQKQ